MKLSRIVLAAGLGLTGVGVGAAAHATCAGDASTGVCVAEHTSEQYWDDEVLAGACITDNCVRIRNRDYRDDDERFWGLYVDSFESDDEAIQDDYRGSRQTGVGGIYIVQHPDQCLITNPVIGPEVACPEGTPTVPYLFDSLP